jgi:ribosome biogenesis GTPase
MNETIVPTEVNALPGRLAALGWTDAVAAAFAPFAGTGLGPARILAEDRGSYLVATDDGEQRAQVGGRFRYEAGDDPAAYPAVGDWVALDRGSGHDDGPAIIHFVVPAGRRSSASPPASGPSPRSSARTSTSCSSSRRSTTT